MSIKIFAHIKILDIFILFFVLILSSIVSVKYYKSSFEKPENVVISTRNNEELHPVSDDAIYNVQGALGDTVVGVKNGYVSILSSPCKEKTCMIGGINKVGESIICLPNGVVVSLKAMVNSNKERDALVSY